MPPTARWRSTSEVCDEIVEVSTPEAAELTKLLENVFRSVNIALVNELAILCDRMGIDVWEVVDAAATKPYGFMSLQARARGWAATACRSIPFYLAWRAREFDMQTEFIELAGEVNQSDAVLLRRADRRARSTTTSKPVQRLARSASSASSYKPGVGDLRESPGAQDHAAARASSGAELVYHDDHVPELPESTSSPCRSTRRSRTPTAP